MNARAPQPDNSATTNVINRIRRWRWVNGAAAFTASAFIESQLIGHELAEKWFVRLLYTTLISTFIRQLQ